MAAPPHRRPGFSRKAQLQIFAGYVLAFTGAFAGLFLLALSYIDPTAFAALRSTAVEITSPVSRGLTAIRVGFANGWTETTAYFDAASKNAALQRELDAARTRLIEARAVEQENAELRRLLGLVEKTVPPVATGRLISSTATSTRRIAILSAGRNQGVRPGQPVRSDRGLIGRVLDAGSNSSQVLLLSDPQNVVPVERVRDGVVAFTQGRSDGRLDVRLINVGINPFKRGDVMVTSGNGGLYTPNVPVAVIEELTSDGAIARLIANPAATDYVIVEEIFKPDLAARNPVVTGESGADDAGTDGEPDADANEGAE